MSVASDDDDVDEVSDTGNGHACCSIIGNAGATNSDEPQYFEPKCMPTPEETDPIEKQEELLDHWRKCSGAHNIEEWCENYLKHPAGWGALLMIHGVPEVTGRLRTKVDNCAIYSALFLSASLSVLFQAPGALWNCSEDDSIWDDSLCQIQEQVFMLLLGCSVIVHMLSILLSMAFTNALNEAARDSDVIRLFSDGQGYIATVRCQNCFIAGVLLSLVCLFQVVGRRAGWKVFCLLAIVCAVSVAVYYRTTSRLFRSSSITHYWRPDTSGLGMRPDDPYDLSLPVAILKQRAKAGQEFLTGDNTTGMSSDIGLIEKDGLTYSALFNPAATQASKHVRQMRRAQSHLHQEHRSQRAGTLMAAFY